MPTEIRASADFRLHPVALRIHGIRATQGTLFRHLASCQTRHEPAEIFQYGMAQQFGHDQTSTNGSAPLRYHTSYLELLRG